MKSLRRHSALYRIHLLLTLATLAIFAAPAISPEAFWPAAFISLAIPFLLAAQIAFLLWWLAARRYYFLVSIGCLLAGWGHLERMAGWSFPAEAATDESSISVLTYNVRGLRHVADNDPVSPEGLVQLIEARDCDLLCLQEVPLAAAPFNQLSDLIRERTRLKYRYSDRNGAMALFSAFPVAGAETKYFPNRANGFQQVDVRIGEKNFRVFNVHLQSNAVTGIAERVASEGNLKEKQTWLDIRGMIGRFKRSSRLRALQAEELALRIAESPHPVILCGDFNDTPHSYTYRRIAAPLRDSFVSRGRGLGVTYAGRIPGLRIDYILADKSLRVLDHRVEENGFSDHRAVWGKLEVSRSESK